MTNNETNKKENTIVLLDAHALIHRAYHALPDFTSPKGEPTGALYGISAMLVKIIKEFRPDHIIACYDLPEPTFRHEAYEHYKAGRAKTEDALVHQLKRSKDIFNAFGIPIYEKPGFEADDILGTIAEKTKKIENLKTIIASGDMDTMQLVEDKKVMVYTLKKGINDTILYDEKAVLERFGFKPNLLIDYKGLRGDPSDNIPGVAGIGEKTATDLILKFGNIENIYKELEKGEESLLKKGIKSRTIKLLIENKEEAQFSKELATIKLDTPINFTIPKKTWTEGFKIDLVDNLFSELGFRTLRERINLEFGAVKPQEHKEEREFDSKTLKKLGIALWLIDSENTNPSTEDIIHHTGISEPKKAEEKLISELKKQKLEKVYYDIELPLINIIEKAEKRGILVDVRYLHKLSKEYHKELKKSEIKIWEHAGREFNINSPKQLGEVLFDEMNLTAKGLKKTAGGSRSTRESELMKLSSEHEIIKDILIYRELQKLLSTYIDNIPSMVGKDGRLHTNLNQTGTTTGRMSSTNPNMQNMPVKEGIGEAIRKAFVAEKGYKLLAFDYSQIEMRVLAVLAKDEGLIKIFKEGKDIHQAVAEKVFGVSPNEITKEMRRRAKIINFGIIYGMGVNALRANIGTDRKEAQTFYDNYFKTFPNITDYFESVKQSARKNGYTETIFGRRRHFSAIKSKIPFIRAQAERMAVNAPIQGSAADFIKIATIKADEILNKKGLKDDVHLLLSVHDELIYEVKEVIIKQASEIIKKAMEEIIDLPVPLVVNVTVGERWGEMEKII